MLGKISLELRAIVGKFVADMSTATASIEGFESKLEKIGTKGGLLAAGIVGLGAVAVKAASDFQQTGNLIERAFGVEKAREIETFSSALSQELGTSLQQTRQGLVSIGMQLKNSLGDASAAEEQSKAIVKLAADISAAMNIPFEDTLNRIQSGLRGETEAIEKLNIFIGESSLKTEALRQGMQQSVETMDEAQKTALRLAAIYRQTADVTGAAASEANTFAGQSARLGADLSNLSRELGEILLPAALDLVKGLRSVIGVFRDLDPGTQKLIVITAGLTAAVGAGTFAVSQFVGAWGTVAPIAKAAGKSLFALTVRVLELAAGQNTAMVADWAIGLINIAKAAGVAAVAVGTFAAAYTVTSEVLEAVGARTVPANVSVFGELKEALSMATDSAKGFLRVYLNLVTALLATSATFADLFTAGTFDFRGKVDELNEWGQALIDDAEAADMMAAAADQLTAEEKALLGTTEGLNDASKKLGGILEGTDAPLAGTAAATAFLKKKQQEAEKAAKALTKSLKEQRSEVRDLEDAFAGLSDTTGVADVLTKAQKAMEKAVTDFNETMKHTGADTDAGIEARANRDSTLALVGDVFAIELTNLLEKVDTDHFAVAIERAREAAAALGLSFDKIVAGAPELQERIASGSHGTLDERNAMKATQAAAIAAFAEQMRELNAVTAGLATRFPEFGAMAFDAQKQLDNLQDAARDGQISIEQLGRASDAVKAIVTDEMGRRLAALAGTDGFTEATIEARKAAEKLGIEFSKVEAAAKKRRHFDEVEAKPGNSAGDNVARKLFDMIPGDQGVAKAIGQSVGGGLDALLGGSLDMKGAAGIAGALVGGLAGVGPVLGQQIGESVAGVLEAVLAPVIAGFSVVGDAVAAMLLSDPRLADASSKVGEVVQSFAGLGAVAGVVVIPTLLALSVAALALGGPLAILALGLGGLAAIIGTVAAISAILVGALVALAAAVLAVVTWVGVWIATVTGLVALISTVATAVASAALAPVAFAAAAAAAFSLVQHTKGFGRAQAIVVGVVDDVVAALEPFGKQFVALAELFRIGAGIFTPFITVFAQSSHVGRLLFFAMKQAALIAGGFALTIAEAMNTIGYVVGALARFMANVFDFLRGPLEAIGVDVDSFVEGLNAAAAAAEQLGSINTAEIEAAMKDLADATYDGAQAEAKKRAIEEAKAKARAEMERKARENADKATETTTSTSAALDSLRESLRNVTSDFKVAYARFQSQDAIAAPSAGGITGAGAGGLLGQLQGLTIENLTVVANDPERFLEKLDRLRSRKGLERSGRLNPSPKPSRGRGE